MAVSVVMPELGESIVEGTIVRWLKNEGDPVQEDEPIVEIMTDKVNTELPAPASGVLKRILAPANAVVRVGQELAIIEAGGEADHETTPTVTEQASESVVLAPPPVPDTAGFYAPSEPVSSTAEGTEARPAPTPAPPAGDGKRAGRGLFLSPVVQKIAREHNLSEQELLSIQGTGAGGRITRADVERYLAQRAAVPQPTPAPAPAPQPTPAAAPREGEEIIPLVGMRKAIAEHLARSYQTAVHVTTVIQVDVSRLVEFRERNKESFQQQYGVRLTYTPFFIKAAADALLEFPMLNASLVGDQIIVRHYVHMGVAVALGEKGEEGLIVPVIRDAHKKSIVELARELEAIAQRARAKSISLAEVQGATFTLTNPGSYGALIGTPLINHPQTAILGTYAIVKMPVVINDMIAIRPMMHLCLSYDHRLIDGMYAGRFLQRVKRAIEEFEFFR
ncbi:Dihydrolipoyllysine-residue succinyltransferase component of 2-oxoglutarate dehydrogenase complex [bacterium HR15]|nr:Dihydrolipoyllysine-residue succinyltransferase component of 2-oxoglutarate dehydrogenase complex [bacterium HR15]